MHTNNPSPRAGRLLLVILFAALAARLCWMQLIPPFEGPDEVAHVKYIRHVATEYRLPVLPKDAWESHRYEDYQMPLYYVAMAPVWSLTSLFGLRAHEALLCLRLATTCLSLGIVVLCFRTARLVCREQQGPAIPLTCASIAALLPMFCFNSAVVNNDALVCLFGALAVYTTTQMCFEETPSRSGLVWLGLALAGAFASKASGILLGPLPVVLALGCYLRTGCWRTALRALSPLLLALLLVSPLWLRNIQLYGGPFGTEAVHENNAQKQPPKDFQEFLSRTRKTTEYLVLSWWGSFGRLNQINAPWSAKTLYVGKLNALFYLLTGLAFAGLSLRAYQWLRSGHTAALAAQPGQLAHAAMLACSLTFLAADFYYGVRFNAPHGRFLYPAMPAFLYLFARGLEPFLKRQLTLILALFLVLANVYLWTRLIYPVYHSPAPFAKEKIAVPFSEGETLLLAPDDLTRVKP